MKLKIDFKSDWHDLLSSVMANDWGMKTDDLANDLPIHYFNALQRRIPLRPRSVLISDTFVCPPEHITDWGEICRMVAEGENLMPYLSRFVDKPELTDSMLNEWGVYHLHFRPRPQRTGPLVFARVTDASFFAVGVFAHGDWYEDNIVETIHRNWPWAIQRWRINGMQGRRMTIDERKALRAKNMNSFFLTHDGTTYGPIGGGVMASGHNYASITTMDKHHAVLEELESILEASMEEIVPYLVTAGYVDGTEVTVKLMLSETHYQSYFPDYAVLASFQEFGDEQCFFHWPASALPVS